jgi:hypothetical protein
MREGIKPGLDANSTFATCLDHNHCERENICFFAICSLFVQDFRRSPSTDMTLIIQDILYGVQVLSDRSKTKTCDPRMIVGIQKYI